MRTFHKHDNLSMMLSLPRVSLSIPCQALSRETTFPAVVQESALKVLIFQGSAPDVEKISLLFPRRQGPKRTYFTADQRLATAQGQALLGMSRARPRAAAFQSAGRPLPWPRRALARVRHRVGADHAGKSWPRPNSVRMTSRSAPSAFLGPAF